MNLQKIGYLVIFFLPIFFYGQDTVKKELTNVEWDALKTNEAYHKLWLEETLKPGVVMKGDSIIFNLEARRLMGDTIYRSQVYKNTYSFEDVQKSLIAMQLQKAFWQMIDLYPEHKKEVLQYIMLYKKNIDTDKVLMGAFYTYAFFDPKITTIEDGKPVIKRPDLFEEKFRLTKEMVAYTRYLESENTTEK